MSVKRRLSTVEKRAGGLGYVIEVVDRFSELGHIEDDAEREIERRMDAARAKARAEHGEGVTVIVLDLVDMEL